MARAAADEVACGVGINGSMNDYASVQAGGTVLLLDRPVAHQNGGSLGSVRRKGR